jgi:hypothetical protein
VHVQLQHWVDITSKASLLSTPLDMEQNGKSRQQQQQQKRKSAWSLPPFQKAMWEALAGLSEEPSFAGPASVKNFR